LVAGTASPDSTLVDKLTLYVYTYAINLTKYVE